MKKIALLERPSYQPTYRIQQETERIRMCSPYGRFVLLRDAPPMTDSSWESFDVNSLPMYFAHGVSLLHMNLAQFQDLLQPYSESDQKSLMFMIESLIQARQLIEEVQAPAEKGSTR